MENTPLEGNLQESRACFLGIRAGLSVVEEKLTTADDSPDEIFQNHTSLRSVCSQIQDVNDLGTLFGLRLSAKAGQINFCQ